MSITLTPLSGPFPSPPAYLLTVDSAKILLDCGVFDALPEFSSSSSPSSSEAATAYLSTLRDLAPSLNLVLLTHPLLSSVGLLPWLKARCGLRCPVYATLPTREMGRWAVEEWVEARSLHEKNEAREILKKVGANGTTNGPPSKRRKGKEVEELLLPVEEDVKMEPTEDEVEGATEEEKNPWDVVWKLTLKEIRDAFLSVNAVRWTQPVHLSGPLKGYTLVAHRSGHTLGGSLYTLRPSLSSSLSPASSSSSLLYAPIFNHVKEHHLDGAALLNGAKIDDAMRRMGVVVVGAERSLITNVKRVDRERKLLDTLTETLRSGHSVLLPTDPSARVLELLVLLESHWSFHNLGAEFPLCLVSQTGKDVVGFVRSLTEWMGGQLASGGGEKILQFSNLRIFPNLAALDATIPPNVPKVILTVPSTLSHGTSRDLFASFSQVPGNLVVLTGRSEEGSLARWLWSKWDEHQEGAAKWGKGKVGEVVRFEEGESVSLGMKRKHYLAGEELEEHLQREQEAAELAAKHQAVLERSRRMLHAADEGGESDSDSDDDAGVGSDAEEDAAAPAPRRRVGGFTGGAGAWDEFLDATTLVGRAGGQTFDIYIKGSYGVRRAEGGGAARFRMFPVVERKRRVDAYGEAIDVDGWLMRGVEDDPFNKKMLEAQREQQEGKRKREEEEADAKPEAPHKYVTDQVQINVVCGVLVVDMEGASDGRALKTILPQINPRKLVIVNGSPSAITDLADSCKGVNAMTQEVYTPLVGECVTVGEETKNFSIRLGDSIMKSLRMSRVEDYDVAYVSGVVQVDPESDIPVLERTALTDAIPFSSIVAADADKNEDDEQVDGDASTTPTEEASTDSNALTAPANLLPPLQPSLFIGDLRLTLLKERLSLLSIPSEFAGEGVLVCGPAPPESFDFRSKSSRDVDPRLGAKAVKEAGMEEALEAAGGKVAVRKMGRGRLVIEGSPGETYFVVRRIVYSLHAQAG